MFPKLQKPGALLGEYEGIQCILCATHDLKLLAEAFKVDYRKEFLK